MKAKLSSVLGDVILAIVTATFALFCFSLFITPVGSFLKKAAAESLTDYHGEQRAKKSFAQKLQAAAIKPEEFFPEVFVSKSKCKMFVASGGQIVVTYPVWIGESPLGDKKTASDRKTPEGEFYICHKEKPYKYHLFLGFSYPSATHAKRASFNQIISNAEEAAILEAWQKQECIPSATPLGGNLGLHGFGGVAEDWTQDGSIAMYNRDIEELYWNIPLRTPLIISD
ncbi:MAG: L,D-transpeptidase [Candidatus Riflebacteria bacterium]|nr:L,D-transpeptidase [Candidatus Riflebacteria bacterium]